MVQKLSYYTVAVVALVGCHLTLWQVPDSFCQETDAADIAAQIRAYKAQLTADATQVEIRLQLAKLYLRIEAYAEAVAEYRQVIATVEADTLPGGTSIEPHSDVPEAYYGLGLAYTGLEKFEDAIAAYQRAIAYAPERAHSHAALGSAYANMHRYAAALDSYKVAVALDANDEMVHHQLGNVYSKRGERAAAKRHQQRAIAIAPTFAAAHYQLGLLYAQEKRWTDAITAYRTAAAHDATLVEVRYNLAQAYARAGDTAAAREQMALFEKRKATLTPLHQLRGALQRTQDTDERAQILANIGRLYLKNGRYEKAVWEYQKALGMDAQLVPAYNGMGIAYTMLGRYSEAIVAQQKALKLQPNFAKAYAGLGLAHFMQNKVEPAIEYYRHAVALEPQFLEAHLKIGIILLNQKRYSEAVEAYQAVLALNRGTAEVYHNLGLCYAHQGQIALALSALEKAVDVARRLQAQPAERAEVASEPSFLAETYYLIGELHAAQGNFNAAESTYLSSGLPKAFHALAQLSAKLASRDKTRDKRLAKLAAAANYAQTAIRLHPNVASYYNTLALIAFRQGDYLQAETAIRKAVELEPENLNYQEGLKQILKR